MWSDPIFLIVFSEGTASLPCFPIKPLCHCPLKGPFYFILLWGSEQKIKPHPHWDEIRAVIGVVDLVKGLHHSLVYIKPLCHCSLKGLSVLFLTKVYTFINIAPRDTLHITSSSCSAGRPHTYSCGVFIYVTILRKPVNHSSFIVFLIHNRFMNLVFFSAKHLQITVFT